MNICKSISEFFFIYNPLLYFLFIIIIVLSLLVGEHYFHAFMEVVLANLAFLYIFMFILHCTSVSIYLYYICCVPCCIIVIVLNVFFYLTFRVIISCTSSFK
jgi:hypothetical protein